MKLTIPRFGLASCLVALTLPAAAQAEPLRVVASFSVIGDFAKQVGGNRIELITLVGPNADAHVYEPRPADARALARADVVLVNGLAFEGFLPRLVESSGIKAPMMELTEGANVLKDPNGGHYHFINGQASFHATPNDPHAWQSVSNAKVRPEHRPRLLRGGQRQLRGLGGQCHGLPGDALGSRHPDQRGDGKGSC